MRRLALATAVTVTVVLLGGLSGLARGLPNRPAHVVTAAAAFAPVVRDTRPAPTVVPTTPRPSPTPTPRRVVAPVRRATPAPVVRRTVRRPRPTAAPRVVPAPAPAYPARLSRVGAGASQVITVTAARYGARVATLAAWARSGSGWTRVFGPWTANLGYEGLAPPGAKREGDGRTPSGVYGFSYDFGVQGDPGVRLPWRAVTGPYDVWDDDPASPSYNLWVDTRTGAAGAKPEPMDNTPSYDEGAVIAYNAARTPGLGSAIFLHVTTGGTTAGCVAIPQGELTEVLRWMRPGALISLGL